MSQLITRETNKTMLRFKFLEINYIIKHLHTFDAPLQLWINIFTDWMW